MAGTAERRKYGRVRARGMSAKLESKTAKALCVIEDVSMGGVFIRTTQLLPLGSPVTLELTTPGARLPLRVAGRVANVITPEGHEKTGRPVGMGVEFGADASLERVADLLGKINVSVAPSTPSIPTGGFGAGASDPFGGDREVRRAQALPRRAEPVPTPSPMDQSASMRSLQEELFKLRSENANLREELKRRDALLALHNIPLPRR